MIRIDLDLSDAQLDRIVRYAVLRDFRRAEPRKAWTTADKKEAVRWAIAQLIKEKGL